MTDETTGASRRMPGSAPLSERVPFARLEGPEGRPLIAHIVVNVETWPFNRSMPRRILAAPHGTEAVPDVPNFSWVAYGMRQGLRRIIAALRERDVPASVALNAAVIRDYPLAARELALSGFELVGHGVEQETLHQVEDEAATITDSLTTLAQLSGTRVRGWLGPGLQETTGTLGHLANLGIEYVLDWVVDDLPVWLGTATRPLLAVPYSLELNDSVLFAAHDFPTSEYLDRLDRTLSVFEREGRHEPRVLALPVHPHLLGVPHRIDSFSTALDRLLRRDDVAFLSAGGIFDWYVEAERRAER